MFKLSSNSGLVACFLLLYTYSWGRYKSGSGLSSCPLESRADCALKPWVAACVGGKYIKTVVNTFGNHSKKYRQFSHVKEKGIRNKLQSHVIKKYKIY